MKDVTFTCPITQEYVHDLLNETFDYQNITVFKGKDEKYNWIYMIINKKNGHFFIGTRSKSNLLNSINIARHPELKADVERLGADAFSRFDLCYYQTYEEMMAVAADQFGDEFISVFSELGTCYNATSIQADEAVKADEDIKADGDVKADEAVKADELSENMIISYRRKYHHQLQKDGTQISVENSECLSFLEKGFTFLTSQVSLYQLTDLSLKEVSLTSTSRMKYFDHDSYKKRKHDEVISLLRSKKWSLCSPEITTRLMSKRRQSQQLALDFDNPVHESKSNPSVVKLSARMRSKLTIFLCKDNQLEPVFFEDAKSYLAQGYYYLGDTIVLIKDDRTKYVTFKSKSQKPVFNEIDFAKMKSREVLYLLENGWKFKKSEM